MLKPIKIGGLTICTHGGEGCPTIYKFNGDNVRNESVIGQ